MKLRTINEATSDERRKIVEELSKLAKEAELAAAEELHTLLKDPVGMVRHTLRGIKADFTLLDDETWWHQMFEFWDHLSPEFLMKAYEDVYTDAMEKIQKAVQAGVVVEGIVKGFLSILGRFAALFLMFAFGGAITSTRKQVERTRRRRERRSRQERGPVGPNREDLPPTPAALAKETFEIRRLNPYIVYKFVEACVNETKQKIAAGEIEGFDDPTAPGDLGTELERPLPDEPREKPFNSGEEVSYPGPPENDEPPF